MTGVRSYADNAITIAFEPIIGLPCWGVRRGQGSILSFEFGAPRLAIREPHASTSTSAKLQQMAARRRVTPVGEWQLFVCCCHWRITASGEPLAHDDSSHDQIEAAAHVLDGQKLTAVAIDTDARSATFSFDLGGVLATWPYEADDEEQWSLYIPGQRVLTYRADGQHGLARRDEVRTQWK